MPKHTPGPWQDDHPFILAPDEEGGTDIYIAEIVDSDDEGKLASVEQQTANARLIAASPAYFEAVAVMLFNEDCGGNHWWRGWEMLKAAHAQAQGD